MVRGAMRREPAGCRDAFTADVASLGGGAPPGRMAGPMVSADGLSIGVTRGERQLTCLRPRGALRREHSGCSRTLLVRRDEPQAETVGSTVVRGQVQGK